MKVSFRNTFFVGFALIKHKTSHILGATGTKLKRDIAHVDDGCDDRDHEMDVQDVILETPSQSNLFSPQFHK